MIEQRETRWLTNYLLDDDEALAQQLVQNERACVQLLLWTFEKVLRPYNGAPAIILLYRRWLADDAPTSEEWTAATAVGSADAKRYLAENRSLHSAPEVPASWAVGSALKLVGALQSAAFADLAASKATTEVELDAAVVAYRTACIAKVRELVAN